MTTFTPISFSSNADLRVWFGLVAVSFGIISIKSLSISFTANDTALIIDWPKSLLLPVMGTKRPILIFSAATTVLKNVKIKFRKTKKIILVSLLILMIV